MKGRGYDGKDYDGEGLMRRRGYDGDSRLPRGVRPRLEGKPRHPGLSFLGVTTLLAFLLWSGLLSFARSPSPMSIFSSSVEHLPNL